MANPELDVTSKERDALTFINEYTEMNGFPPSQREVAEALGWAGVASANEMMRVLIAKGLLTAAGRIPRGINITSTGMKALTEEL